MGTAMERMSRLRASHAARRLGVLTISAMLIAVSMSTPAGAINTPVLTPSPLSVNGAATYSVRAIADKNGETVGPAVFTFPANTDLSGVSLATVSLLQQPGNVIRPITSVQVVANTVTVNFLLSPPRNTTFDVIVGGVISASQPGAYSCPVTIQTDKGQPGTTPGAYTLTANTTAVSVGTVALGSTLPLAASTYAIPVTLGARGRLSGTTAVGANTIVVTFPVGTTVPAAPPAGSVTIGGTAAGAIAVSGQQVTLTLAAAQTLAGGSTFNVAFTAGFGLVNPAAGTHSLTVRTSAESGTGTSPGYVIAPTPYLTMTIDTATVDFGAVDPGVTSTPVAVNVTVDSSAGFTISRVFSGDVGLLGLVVTGAADGAKSAGLATYADSYTITPPWTTTPDVTLNAQVQYTAVQ